MKFLYLFFIFVLSGCANTKITGFIDPAYESNYEIDNVIVLSDGFSLEEQQSLENTFVEKFSMHNISTLRGLNVFPPTRKVETDKILDKLKSLNVDAVLYLTLKGKDISTTYIPPTFYPGTSTSYISTFGNTAAIRTYTSPGFTTGGYSIENPIISVDMILFDVKKENAIWRGEGVSDGNGLTSFSDLVSSIATSTVDEFANLGIVADVQLID